MHISPDDLKRALALAELERMSARRRYGILSDEYENCRDRVCRLKDILSEAEERDS